MAGGTRSHTGGRVRLCVLATGRLSSRPGLHARLTAIDVLSIPAESHQLRSGARFWGPSQVGRQAPDSAAGYSVLSRCRPLVIFGVCVMFSHFADAPLLPLVGQEASAAAHPQGGDGDDVRMHHRRTGGDAADRRSWLGGKPTAWGREAIFLAGFAILPLRAVLYTFSERAGFWLIGVQLLDGVGAGIFGALAPLVVADIMRGTGR